MRKILVAFLAVGLLTTVTVVPSFAQDKKESKKDPKKSKKGKKKTEGEKKGGR